MHVNLVKETFENAPIQAFKHPLVAPPPHGFRGGLVLEGRDEHNKLRHSRYWRPVDTFSQDATYDMNVRGEMVYAGPIYHQFGHFLSEMAHRILPSIKNFKCQKMLFVDVRGELQFRSPTSFPTFIQEILAFFRISFDDVTVINKNTIVDVLHVVEQGSDFGGGPKLGYLEDLKEFSRLRLDELTTDQPTFKKVYVSRRNLPVGGSFLGERVFGGRSARRWLHDIFSGMPLSTSADECIPQC